MDLSTDYLGMELRTPLVASASPLSETISGIRRLEDAGAAAVVLYSLFEEQLRLEQLELHHHTTFGTESFAEALDYFPEPEEYKTGPDQYLEHIANAKQAVDIPIIASLNGSSLGGWTDFAKKIEQAGADALELNLYSIPTSINISGERIEENDLEIVSAIREQINIPIAVKLSPFYSNMANMAKRFSEAGANALVMFNRFYQPDIDLEVFEVTPNVLLSTPQAMRLPMRWIAILYGRVKVDFAATSGIHQPQDAVKMLLVGANITMMASALLRNGVDHIQTMEAGLGIWMQENEYESVRQMQGSLSQTNSPDPSAFERAQYMRAISSLPQELR